MIRDTKFNPLILAYIVPLIMFLTLFTTRAYADEPDLTYTISVKPVESQIDKSATYYDLLVSPGQKETLTVVITNTGDNAKDIKVTPTNAITNQNGIIDYSPQSENYVYDTSLSMPFTSMVGESQTVTVNAGESKEVIFDLKIPDTPFTGTILGAFVAEVVDDSEPETNQDSGVQIVNKFQLVKAVMLREDTEPISPELVLNDVKPTLVAYRTAVTANLQNTESTMFGNMTIDANVTKKGQTDIIRSVTKENLEMAPNSNFDFPIMWDNQKLEAGEYTLSLTATSGEKNWTFTKDFIITADDSKRLNAEAVDIDDTSSMNWLYILIVILVIIIISMIIIYIINKNKSKT